LGQPGTTFVKESILLWDCPRDLFSSWQVWSFTGRTVFHNLFESLSHLKKCLLLLPLASVNSVISILGYFSKHFAAFIIIFMNSFTFNLHDSSIWLCGIDFCWEWNPILVCNEGCSFFVFLWLVGVRLYIFIIHTWFT